MSMIVFSITILIYNVHLPDYGKRELHIACKKFVADAATGHGKDLGHDWFSIRLWSGTGRIFM